MATNDRRYRPVRPSGIPQSFSMADIDSRLPLAFPPTPDRYRDHRYRRPSDNLSGPGTLHSVPTIAKSGLTASVSTNDISQPTPKFRPRFSDVNKATPTRIPSPVFQAKSPPFRHVSTPVLPSQKTGKENAHPKTHRLLRPISPSCNTQTPLLPKSRTMGVLSNFTSSFSRPSISLGGSRQASVSSYQSADIIDSTPTRTTPLLPLSTTNIRQIHTAKPNSFWCGRFQALNDRFRNDALDLEDAERQHRAVGTLSPAATSSNSSISGKSQPTTSGHEDKETKLKSKLAVAWVEDDDKRSSKAFHHLEALCTTTEAKKSLWEFQLIFARMEGKPKLLPSGGKMTDDRGGWISRVGRAMVGGTNTGLGRTGMGMGKSKGSSMLGLAAR